MICGNIDKTDKLGFSQPVYKYLNIKPENAEILKENINLSKYDPDEKGFLKQIDSNKKENFKYS